MKSATFLMIATALAVTVLAKAANAGTILPDRASLNSLLGANATSEDFEKFNLGLSPSPQAISGGIFLDSSTILPAMLGVPSQGPGLVVPGVAFIPVNDSGVANLVIFGPNFQTLPAPTKTLGTNASTNILLVDFTQPVNAFGLDVFSFASNPVTFQIFANDDATLLETDTVEFRENPSKHVVLLAVHPETADKFYLQLSQAVGHSKKKEAFVFIHGYWVTFEDAARRTAQIAYDLGFAGAPILYSWPSSGTGLGYAVDYDSVHTTVPNLKEFLTEIASKSGAQTVHLIAHSLGNRALTEALKELRVTLPPDAPPMFSQVVLAAPDIDADVFMVLAQAIRGTAKGITLYASSRDEALEKSKTLRRGRPRAGDSSSIVIVSGVDTIDATAVDTSFSGHSYIGDNRSILSDVYNLFKGEAPPRFGLNPIDIDRGTYWIFRP